MSELSTGRTFSEEVRKKNSEAQKGKKLTAETRANMSLGKTGEKNPMWGKKLSEETRALLKLSQPDRVGIVITDQETKNVTHHTSIREAARYLGIAKSTVSKYLLSGKPYKDQYFFTKL